MCLEINSYNGKHFIKLNSPRCIRILAPLTAPIGALVHDVKELLRPKEVVFKDPPFSPRCITTLQLWIRLDD